MSNTNKLSGKISSGVPGTQGVQGDSASNTFYGNSEITRIESNIKLKTKDGSDIGYVYRLDGTFPKVDDRVIYKTDDEILLYNITSLDYDYSDSIYIATVEQIDNFTPTIITDDAGIDINDIDISIDVNVRNVGLTVNTPRNIMTYAAGAADFTATWYVCNPYTTSEYVPFIVFIINSNNGRKLKGFRVMLEFSTNHTSPGVDNIMCDKFGFADETFFMDDQDYDYGDHVYSTSLRGCLANYSNVGPSSVIDKLNIINFDRENLENFYIMLKDFNEGEYTTRISKSVGLMLTPLSGRGYECRVMIFVKTANGFYEKRCLGTLEDLTSLI